MTRATPSADWATLTAEAALLCADAGLVMMLRSWRVMAGGPLAGREIERALSEKVAAGAELAGVLAGGGINSPEAAARAALGIYGKHVRGNRRRLG